MEFEVSAFPSSIIVGSANFTVIMETKGLFFPGEEAKPTLPDPDRQEIFRIGASAKSTM